MTPQTGLQIGAGLTLVVSLIGFLVANRSSIGGVFSRIFSGSPAAVLAPQADDDTLDFQALRRLQKRFGGKPDVLAALKTVAASFVEG